MQQFISFMTSHFRWMTFSIKRAMVYRIFALVAFCSFGSMLTYGQELDLDLTETETYDSDAKGEIRQVDLIFDGSGEPQNVSVRVVNGQVFLDGDILIGTEAEVFGGAAIRNVAARVWPNATIPYTIKAGSGYSTEELNMISYAINHVSTNSNLCLVPRTTETNYVEFNKDNAGCSSPVGMSGGKQIITTSITCGAGGTIHEILHAAGHWHEQSRADRDTYVSIDLTHVPSTLQHNFNKYSTGADVGPYDYGSIMHYSETAFTTNGSNSITVIKPPGTNNTDIGQRLNMSAGDIVAINQVYTSNPSCTPITGLPSNLRIKDKGTISINPMTGMVTVSGIVIENSGNSPSVVTPFSMVRASSNGNFISTTNSLPILAAGATHNLATINYDGSGLAEATYSFGLRIDPFGTITDGNNSDNRHDWTFPTMTLPLCTTPTPALGTITQPTNCISTDGSIPLTGLIANTVYNLNYQKDGVSIIEMPITTDGAGNYAISGLTIGDYTDINVDLTGCVSANLSQTLSNSFIVPTFSLGTITPPPTCGYDGGSIELIGLDASTSYSLNYKKNGVAVGPITFSSDGSGTHTVSSLSDGNYTDIQVTLGICPSSPLTATLTPNFTAPAAATCQNMTGMGLGSFAAGLMSLKIGTETRATNNTFNDQFIFGGDGFLDFTDDCSQVFNLTEGATYSYEIETFLNNHSVKAWIDYDNNNVFAVSEMIFDESTSSASNGGDNKASGTFIVPAATVNGTPLKLRVVCDLNTVTDACYNPEYGQSENYPVYIFDNSCSSPVANIGTVTNPTTCSGSDGSIQLTGLTASTSYALNYKIDAVAQSEETIMTDGSGNYTMSSLSAGAYTEINVTLNACTSADLSQTLTDPSTPSIVLGTVTNPTTCMGSDGSIQLTGLTATTTYTLNHKKDGVAQSAFSIATNASGEYTLTGLDPAAYTEIKVTLNGCMSNAVSQTLTGTNCQTTCNDPDLKIATIYGTGTRGFGGDGGLASIAHFNAITDITLDANGNIFVIDAGNNRIRKIDANTGIITTIAGTGVQGYGGDGGQATAAQFNFPRAIRFDANGDLYIADSNNNRIRKINMTTGIITTVVGDGNSGFSGDGGPATSASINFPGGIVFNSTGELIFTDSNNGSLRKVDVSGNIQTIHGFAFNLPQQLLIDGNDDVYLSDFLNRQIKKLDASNGYAITVIAGTGTGGYSGDGGLATVAQVNLGQGASMALDAADNLYFADVYSHAIRKIDANTGIITTIAGTGVAGYSGDNGLATQATINGPHAIAFNADNELLITDSSNDAIRILSCENDCTVAITDRSITYGDCLVQGNSQVTVTATCSGCTNGTSDLEYSIDGVNFQMSNNFDNLKDSTYTIIVRDKNNPSCRVIEKVTLDQDFDIAPPTVICQDVTVNLETGGMVTISSSQIDNGSSDNCSATGNLTFDLSQNTFTCDDLAGETSEACIQTTLIAGMPTTAGSTNGTGTAASFSFPRALVTDAAGNIYVADDRNHLIRKITPAGVVSTFAGMDGVAGSANGTGTNASFNRPMGLTIDQAGNLFVTDVLNYLIRKITPAGVVSTFAGMVGVSGSADGIGTNASFGTLRGLATDKFDNIYVGSYHNTIRKITPAGVVTTIAGTPGVTGSADGNGASASFNLPIDVAVDTSGNVLVAEFSNHTIRKITPNGDVTTLAGTAGVNGATNGTGANASFNYLSGIVVAEDGTIYATEQSNNMVRKITPVGVVTTFAGNGTRGHQDGGNSEATLFAPYGITLDPDGNVLVTEISGQTIRKIEIVPDCATTTLTVTDESGNSASCLVQVHLTDTNSQCIDPCEIDTTAPIITCPNDTTLIADIGMCTTAAPDLTAAATVTDNCGAGVGSMTFNADTYTMGSIHCLVIADDGSLWGWGNDSWGQLGNGAASGSITPIQLNPDTDWARVSAGEAFSLGLKSDGTIYGWGINNSGQVGDGTTTNQDTVTQIGSDSDWTAMSAGYTHSLALKSDGTLWAWGNNFSGQIGDGSSMDRTSPVQIGSSTDWTFVSAGRYHSLGIKSDGTLWAWGSNGYGRLGTGGGSTTQPVQVGTATDWTTVSSGNGQSLGIKSDGTLWGWGWNLYSQLGDGTTTSRTVPTQNGTGTNWAGIGTGSEHSIAYKTDGTIWSFGTNTYGQLGNGNNTTSNVPVQVGANTDWLSVTSGIYSGIGLRSNGELWSWGRNQSGLLGDGTATNSNVPVQVVGLIANDGSPSFTVTQTPAPGTPLAIGDHNITLSTMDLAGNLDSCVVVVSVVDIEAPVLLGCSTSVTLTLNVCDEFILTAADLGIIATDNCAAEPTITLSQTAFIEAGTTAVTVTASDNATPPNTSICVVDVIMEANMAPCCDLAITAEPTSQAICDGEDVAFTTNATSSAGGLTYQWQQVCPANMWTSSNPNSGSLSVFESNGMLYAGTSNGMVAKPVGESTWTIYNSTNGPSGFPATNTSVQAVFESDGVIYAGMYLGGLATLDIGNGATSWTHYNSGNSPVSSVSDLFVADGVIYVAGNGIHMLDIGNGATTWTTLNTATVTPSGFPNNDVRSVHVDNGVLYAATFNGGLASWDFGNNATSWTVYAPTTSSPSNFPHITVRDVYTENGTIYAATYGGIATLENGASSWTVYNSTTGPTGLPLNAFSSVHVDNGVIYAGMQGGGMAWLDVPNGATSWETVTQNQMGFPSTIVFDVFAKNGNKYAATTQGIAEYVAAPSDISGATSATYTFTPQTGDEACTYQVKVTDANGCEVTSAAANFTNEGPAPDIATIATQMNICSTATVDLTMLTITDNNNVPNTTTTFHSAAPSSATDMTNQLSSTIISVDQTVYVMVASTSGCFDVESFLVDIVACCDLFISHPADATICDGEDVTFSATATSSAGGFTYQWQKTCTTNGVTDTTVIVGATAPTYTFTPQAGDENCIYRLVVTDAICAGISGSASFNVLAPASCCDMMIGAIGTQTNCPNATLDLTSVSIPVTNSIAGTDTTFHSAAPTSATDMSNQLASTIVATSQTVYVMVANVTTGCMAVSGFAVDITTNCNSSGESFDLSGTLAPGITYVYNACDNIISVAIIPNATDVDYLAGEYIILKPGFHAQAGSDLLAKIVPCAPILVENETRQARESNVDLAPQVALDLALSAKVYPNPIQDYTRIEITLPQEQAIQLDLYDMSGRKITNLVNGAMLPVGVHHFDWQVQQVNGGMYLLVLNGQVVSKLAVIK